MSVELFDDVFFRTAISPYQCDIFRCNQKRDAIRSMTFSKLPPVLNIQLARYVFDRWVN